LQGGEILLCVVGSIGKIGVAPPHWAGANIARRWDDFRAFSQADQEHLQTIKDGEKPKAQQSSSPFKPKDDYPDPAEVANPFETEAEARSTSSGSSRSNSLGSTDRGSSTFPSEQCSCLLVGLSV
jgi:hypothetical protein